MRVTDSIHGYVVTEGGRHPPSPRLEPGPSPFESMITMAQFASTKCGDCRVPISIWGCQDHGFRPCMSEHGMFESWQTFGIDVLDDFHERRRIEPH
jgi:hypothetical protein